MTTKGLMVDVAQKSYYLEFGFAFSIIFYYIFDIIE